MKLLQMPAISGSIERIFSNFAMIQSKLRNRPGVQKPAKLVLCYKTFRSGKELDWCYQYILILTVKEYLVLLKFACDLVFETLSVMSKYLLLYIAIYDCRNIDICKYFNTIFI